jgi:hypothetical protein
MIVVIPTNREVKMPYLQPLIDSGARFIVIDDTEGSIRIDHPQFEVFNWADRRRLLGDLDVAIPRANGASRSLGFYLAWHRAEQDEIIVALDDDCEVYHADFAQRVQRALASMARPQARAEGRHLNIVDLYAGPPRNLFPRGFPYSERGAYRPCEIREQVMREPKFCLGLWKQIFDVNAIDKIKGPAFCHPDIELQYPSVVISPGNLVSVCSMNMQFRLEVAPAAYQLPMHVEVMPGWVIDRYGDIWGGFILKALMDLKGDAMVVGEPMIRHVKEGNVQRNTWQEHICHMVNDEFLGILAAAVTRIRPASYLEMMAALNDEFRRATSGCSALLKPYFEHLTVALAAWTKALAK